MTLATLIITAPKPSLAVPPRTPVELEVQALLRQGDKASYVDRLAEAVAAWRAAYDLQPDLSTACDIGRGAFRIGDMRLAAEFLARCVRNVPPPTTPADLQRQREQADELASARKEVAAVAINVSRAGAEVSIDGRPIGRSPLPEAIFIAPGLHRIRAALDGELAEESVDLAKGSFRSVDLTLVQPARSVDLTLVQPARSVDLTLVRPVPVPVPVPVSAPTLTPKVASTNGHAWLYIGGSAVTAVSLATGVAFLVAASNKQQEAGSDVATGTASSKFGCGYAALEPSCSAADGKNKSSESHTTVAKASFVGAGIVAAITFGHYSLFGRREGAPVITPRVSGRGIEVVGTW